MELALRPGCPVSPKIFTEMSRRFQFSLMALMISTGWLAIAAMAAVPMWRVWVFPLLMPFHAGMILMGLGGAVGALVGRKPLYHSFIGVLGGLAVQVAIVTAFYVFYL